MIHVVDLDAARSGIPMNRGIVANIACSVDVPIQAGGGVRGPDDVEALLATGVRRVVMGTSALERPQLVRTLVIEHEGKVAIGVDARDGRVAVRGWVSHGDATVSRVLREFAGAPVAAFIVTDIGRDGTQDGPNVEQLRQVLAEADGDVIASGGVGSLDHLVELASLEVEGRELAGVIVGRALYEGAFTVGEAIAACGP